MPLSVQTEISPQLLNGFSLTPPDFVTVTFPLMSTRGFHDFAGFEWNILTAFRWIATNQTFPSARVATICPTGNRLVYPSDNYSACGSDQQYYGFLWSKKYTDYSLFLGARMKLYPRDQSPANFKPIQNLKLQTTADGWLRGCISASSVPPVKLFTRTQQKPARRRLVSITSNYKTEARHWQHLISVFLSIKPFLGPVRRKR